MSSAFFVSTSDRVSDLMEALIPSVSFLPPQATSREERKRDFEKIFAHYDVVSSTGMCWVYNWAVMLQYLSVYGCDPKKEQIFYQIVVDVVVDNHSSDIHTKCGKSLRTHSGGFATIRSFGMLHLANFVSKGCRTLASTALIPS